MKLREEKPRKRSRKNGAPTAAPKTPVPIPAAEAGAQESAAPVAKPSGEARIESVSSAEAETMTAVRRIIAAFDSVEDVIQMVEDLAFVSKRSRRRHGPLLRRARIARRELLRALGDFQVHPVPQSNRVDPSRDEILGVRTSPVETEEGTVADVVRSGFLRDGRVLRPRMVVAVTFAPTREQGTNLTRGRE